MKDWFEDVEKQTLETLPDFMKRIFEDLEHDRENPEQAVAACALAAYYASASKAELSVSQRAFVKWDILRKGWNVGEKTGAKIIDYDVMIYPECEWIFNPVIPQRTFAKVQRLAEEKLKSENLEDIPEYVVNHWRKIAGGKVPFNWKVDKEDD